MKAYPKVFTIGQVYIDTIFSSPVILEEKLDGSSFIFWKINNEVGYRSKGQILYKGSINKMFKIACDYIDKIVDKIPNNTVFYSEYLQKQKHNTLTYSKIPKNNLMLFGASNAMCDVFVSDRNKLEEYANLLDIDVVPLLYSGTINTPEELTKFLDNDSYLGGAKIEGVVVKNYDKQTIIGGVVLPFMAGKFVSEKFKEVHQKGWKTENTNKGKWESYIECFKTEARWEKAFQHLRDAGTVNNSPKDIGNLIQEVKKDITDEEKENIKEFLWKEFGEELLRRSTSGLPIWYKEKLLNNNFKTIDV